MKERIVQTLVCFVFSATTFSCSNPTTTVFDNDENQNVYVTNLLLGDIVTPEMGTGKDRGVYGEEVYRNGKFVEFRIIEDNVIVYRTTNYTDLGKKGSGAKH